MMYDDTMDLDLAVAEAVRLLDEPIDALLSLASSIRNECSGDVISWSPKVFIPVSRCCRNRCNYCSFRRDDNDPESGFIRPEKIMEIVRRGEEQGALEAMITLGERPESTSASARAELARLGFESTVDYLRGICGMILDESTLIPHVNAGVMSSEEMSKLKPYCGSMGLMLETSSTRLLGAGQAHEFSPGKNPSVRLEMIENAGRLKIPFTTGILVGIGESWQERIESLIAISIIARRYGSIQEVIVQNFCRHAGTSMMDFLEPTLDDMTRTVAMARILLPPEVIVQAPPNLLPNDLKMLISAGISDWGGVSTVTADEINPEYPWPEVRFLQNAVASCGFTLKKRLTVHPRFVADKWLVDPVKSRVFAMADDEGFAAERLAA